MTLESLFGFKKREHTQEDDSQNRTQGCVLEEYEIEIPE